MDGSVRLIAGAMSGTSADGVDAAVVQIAGRGLEMSAKLLCHRHVPYETPIRQRIFAMRESGSVALSDLASLAREISLVYADAVKKTLAALNLKASDLGAVAAHGQTLFHAPPNTIQWLDPSLLAAEVGCAVVSDFRRADCAAGGQGAPLVPFADYILFHSDQIDRALVNIGGIANITCLHKAVELNRVIAWDTGPGNCISDYLMRKHSSGKDQIDRDGALAAKGRVVRELSDAFCSDVYFEKIGSKSTDGPFMVGLYEQALAKLGRKVSLEDQLATACFITVSQICKALIAFGMQPNVEVIVSGGGTRNRAIMSHFNVVLGKAPKTTEEFGIPSEAKEAIAFALLGAATLDGIPSNVPSATGAKRPVVLGSITPRP
jgi:anhydro-N-acetylmuramic acid kinase